MSDFTFTASDNTPIFVYKWLPATDIKGIVHIVHGLADHAGRYTRTAKSLNAHGYAVYAADLRGHGNTARNQEELGFLAEENGWNRVALDVQEIMELSRTEFPAVPLILLGHSMGSYLAQQIIYERPTLLAAAILSAPNGKPSLLAKAGRGIARAERLRLGKRGRSQFINSLTFGKFNQQFPNAETPFDWLTRDTTEVKLYFNDSKCGFIATTQLWIDFMDGISELSKPAHKTRIPKDFPIHILAGGKDPVCENGRGAEDLAAEYRQAGLQRVTCKIYPEGRHEMLNETNRHEVMSDLVTWLNDKV